MKQSLRIAMLAHSTNPRGGVVHALQLSEALTDLGHSVVLHAPDASGKGLFRNARCEVVPFPVGPAPSDMTAMVRQRIEDYLAYFQANTTAHFDLFHAHDGISGNALATLKLKGKIPGFLRTVHHIDDFADPELSRLQARSINEAAQLFTVSNYWRSWFQQRGRNAVTVGNGVDAHRFTPVRNATDTAMAQTLKRGSGPVFLAVGGVEERKNTLGILRAFEQVLAVQPAARLFIAGGVSLLDHSRYQAEFSAILSQKPTLAATVTCLGRIADEDMPALFRNVDALVFPSLKEGFGLVVLEAMASATPVILSSMEPFTDYVTPEAAFWCNPHQPASIAGAMLAALSPEPRASCIAAGQAVAARYDWQSVAAAHVPAYHEFLCEKERLYA
jgi:glycosyltransferase-like protein